MSRTLKVFALQGNNLLKLEDVEITTYAQLQSAINAANGTETDFSQIKAVLGGSKLALTTPDAVIPEGDQTIFLMQVKGKAGGLGPKREGLYARIRGLITRDGEDALNFFNEGFHYTNKSDDLLESLLNDYTNTSIDNTEELQFDARAVSNIISRLVCNIEDDYPDDALDCVDELKLALGLDVVDPEINALKEEGCNIAEQMNDVYKCQ